MRIAYVHATYAYYIAYQHLREALAKIADVRFYTMPKELYETDPPLWDTRQIVGEFDPDVIVLDVNNTVFRSVSNMENIDCLKIMMSDDPHNWLERQSVFMNKARIDIMLMMNYGRWYGKPEDYPRWWITPWKLNSERPEAIYGGNMTIAEKYQRQLNYPCKFYNFPEAVNTQFFKDRGFDRTCDVFNSGSFVRQSYPFRCDIYEELKHRPLIKSCIRPSFGYSWEDYANMVAKSKMFVDGIGIFGYTSQRFTQAMASKTLMVSTLPFDNVDNHFIPDENFVEINKDNFVDKILYYKKHEDERKRIVENAYQTILKFHTSEIRARQLIDIIEKNQKLLRDKP